MSTVGVGWCVKTRHANLPSGSDARNSVTTLDELRIPPGNQLEALKGDREGEFSIRINDKYRICFRWTNLGPDEVEIVDYH